MRYIKTYESYPRGHKIIYQCQDFILEINSNNIFCISKYDDSANVVYTKGGIIGMADLVRLDSKFIEDEKLRNIELRSRDKNFELDNLFLYDQKMKNLLGFRSGIIPYFIGDEYAKALPEDIFKDLIVRYYPLVIDTIKESNTLGDVIEEFKLIYKKILGELLPIEVYKDANKYNL